VVSVMGFLLASEETGSLPSPLILEPKSQAAPLVAASRQALQTGDLRDHRAVSPRDSREFA
jgi:hypothetical protein